LLQIVMLLQARGSSTADRLARELGVSQRTIYRDMEALDTAGVPIVAEAGPSGGYTLLPGYRSELTGLTEDETAALGLLTVPGATADLGASEALRHAVEKILASVPRFASSAGERMRERILVNPTADTAGPDTGREGQGDARGGHATARERVGVATLSRLQEALLAGRRISIVLSLPFALQVTQIADPLGLVFDTGRWHLIYSPVGDHRSGPPRSVALAGIVDAVALAEPSAIAPGFDLREFWATYAREARRRSRAFVYEIRVAPSAIADVRGALGASMGVTEPADSPDAWPRFRCTAPDLTAARSALLPLGGAVEVVGPPELRRSIADFAEQAASRYRNER